MGSHSFMSSVYAPTPHEGYQVLVEEAFYNYGHDPYNGTISTTFDFAMIPFEDGEGSVDWAERILDDPRVEKRQSCACVEATHVEKNDKGWPLWHFAGWAAS